MYFKTFISTFIRFHLKAFFNCGKCHLWGRVGQSINQMLLKRCPRSPKISLSQTGMKQETLKAGSFSHDAPLQRSFLRMWCLYFLLPQLWPVTSNVRAHRAFLVWIFGLRLLAKTQDWPALPRWLYSQFPWLCPSCAGQEDVDIAWLTSDAACHFTIWITCTFFACHVILQKNGPKIRFAGYAFFFMCIFFLACFVCNG